MGREGREGEGEAGREVAPKERERERERRRIMWKGHKVRRSMEIEKLANKAKCNSE